MPSSSSLFHIHQGSVILLKHVFVLFLLALESIMAPLLFWCKSTCFIPTFKAFLCPSWPLSSRLLYAQHQLDLPLKKASSHPALGPGLRLTDPCPPCCLPPFGLSLGPFLASVPWVQVLLMSPCPRSLYYSPSLRSQRHYICNHVPSIAIKSFHIDVTSFQTHQFAKASE